MKSNKMDFVDSFLVDLINSIKRKRMDDVPVSNRYKKGNGNN